MKASGSPPIYRFPLLYCLNFIAQYDKLLPRTLKNSTSQDLNGKKKRQIRDYETHPKRFWDFEIGPNFSETYVFRSTILYPYTFRTIYGCCGRKTGIFGPGPYRRVHKDPRLNSNRGHWVKFCVRKNSPGVNLHQKSKIPHCSLTWIDCKNNKETYKVDIVA